MDYYTDPPKNVCKELQHGMVIGDKCQRRCQFFCFPPYKPEDRVRFVNCDVTSRNWLTSSGKAPCIKPGVTSTTQKAVDFDFNYPTKYNDFFNMDDYKTKVDIPTQKPFGFDMDNVKVPTIKPFNFDDEYSSTVNEDNNSAVVPGLIVTGLLLLTIFSVFTRLWIVRINTRRRQERIHRIQRLMEQVTSESRTRTATQQRLPVTSPQNVTEASREQYAAPTLRQTADDTEQGNENTGMFIVIRRIFRFPLSNPYRTLQNPPSPPPYDAENVPPPAYEETVGTVNSFSPDATNHPTHDGSSEVPEDSPPPYSENI